MRLIIMGAGGFGRVVADIACQLNIYENIQFLDDNDKSSDVVGICGDYRNFRDNNTSMFPAFGNNKLRMKWIECFEKEKIIIPKIIHPLSYISPTAKIAHGTIVLPNASINSYTIIEKGCIINLGAIIDHNCCIKFGSHICLGAVIKAYNNIPEYTKIEAGRVIENNFFI